MTVPLRGDVAKRGVYWADYTLNGCPVVLVIDSRGDRIAERPVFPGETDMDIFDRSWRLLGIADPIPGQRRPDLRIV